MADWAGAYRESRERLTALVRELPPELVDAPVPACPEWLVRDVVGHLAGIAVALPAGDRPGAEGAAAWGARLVAARHDRPVAEVLDEWTAAAPAFEELVAGSDTVGPAVTGDVVTHEQDVRGAVGRPGARDSAAVEVALEGYVAGLGRRLGDRALTVRAGGHEWTVGEGSPEVAVAASPWELLRALTGRRTPDQVRALDWAGDPEPFVAVFSAYGWPAGPLEE